MTSSSNTCTHQQDIALQDFKALFSIFIKRVATILFLTIIINAGLVESPLSCHPMPYSKPAIVPQPSYIPHPITRFRLCIECLIHTLTTQFNGNTILANGRRNGRAFPKHPCPRSPQRLVGSMGDISDCPGLAFVTC
jgi:hypothetical protein